MSIVRVGMAEDSRFGDGYEAIFGKKKAKAAKKAVAKKAPTKKPASSKGKKR